MSDRKGHWNMAQGLFIWGPLQLGRMLLWFSGTFVVFNNTHINKENAVNLTSECLAKQFSPNLGYEKLVESKQSHVRNQYYVHICFSKITKSLI